MKLSRFIHIGCASAALFVCIVGDARNNSYQKVFLDSTIKKNEWITLFDGKTLNGWHYFNQKDKAILSWAVEDGCLVSQGHKDDAPSGGDIVTNQQYDNFELEWEWKCDKGSNSGVMYHVQEGTQYHGTSETGPEYQLIDDVSFPSPIFDWQKTGADYAMTPPNTSSKELKKLGEWNTSKIIFNKGHVEHWLNGKRIVSFEAWTPEWEHNVRVGKWQSYPGYGKAKTGVIALQNHGNKTYFRNIRIKEL
ncbi:MULTISPECIES: 3-keto-disaccharide hydrolase [Chitinophagaceae]